MKTDYIEHFSLSLTKQFKIVKFVMWQKSMWKLSVFDVHNVMIIQKWKHLLGGFKLHYSGRCIIKIIKWKCTEWLKETHQWHKHLCSDAESAVSSGKSSLLFDLIYVVQVFEFIVWAKCTSPSIRRPRVSFHHPHTNPELYHN